MDAGVEFGCCRNMKQPVIPGSRAPQTYVAWKYIFLKGQYTFISGGNGLDLDAIIDGLTLSQPESRLPQI